MPTMLRVAYTRTVCFVLACAAGSVGAAAADLRLVDAARQRNTAAVRALLQQRVDVNARRSDGTSALHWAVHRDEPVIVDLLLKAGADPRAATDTGVTPLYLACTNRSAALVERLIAAGGDPNAALLGGETVLMECARTGTAAAVGALLAAGAEVNRAESAHGQTPLMWAVSRRHSQVVAALIGAGADVGARSLVYEQTVNGGSNATARVEGNYPISKGGMTPLLFAARTGDVASARLLLAAKADVNDAMPDGTSALVLAAHSGQGPVARLLLEHGANADDAAAGYTALHAAVLRGDRALVDALLQHSAEPNAPITKGMALRRTSQDFELPMGLIGATPFALAARFLEVDIMNALAAAGADPTLALGDGTTPLMMAAGLGAPAQADRRGLSVLDGGRPPDPRRVAEAVTAAVALGGDVNAANRAGDTALHGAAALGYDAAVQTLVASGARLNLTNSRGLTPLMMATGARRTPARSGANAFVDTFNQSTHPTTAALLRALGAIE